MTSEADKIEELADSVAQERAEVDETLKQIQHRLTPGQLIDEILRHGQEPARNALASLGSSVAAHPIPALLVGTALVWLALETRSKGEGDTTIRNAKP